MIETGRIQSFYLLASEGLKVFAAYFIDLFTFYDAFNGFLYARRIIMIAKNHLSLLHENVISISSLLLMLKLCTFFKYLI